MIKVLFILLIKFLLMFLTLLNIKKQQKALLFQIAVILILIKVNLVMRI